MFKKIIMFAVIAVLASTLWGQSLLDNEFYQQMLELKTQSEQAFDEGDYIESRRLAEEARSYKTQSDEWIETQLAAYRARAALNRVKDRLAEASTMKAAVNFPAEFEEGRALYDQAYSEFHDDAAYVDSLATSNKALNVLSVIVYIPMDGILPAYYTVRLLPGNVDCLWNIAGYDFIYGDSWMWKKIYEANKDKMPRENDPDLIHPGMILSIPARDGEQRSGTWEDGEIR